MVVVDRRAVMNSKNRYLFEFCRSMETASAAKVLPSARLSRDRHILRVDPQNCLIPRRFWLYIPYVKIACVKSRDNLRGTHFGRNVGGSPFPGRINKTYLLQFKYARGVTWLGCRARANWLRKACVRRF